MRLAVFLGTCAAAAIAIPTAAGAIMQRGEDADRGVSPRMERGETIETRVDKDSVDRFESSRVGTRIREKDESRRSVLPARQEDHPTPDPHDTHGTPDPHDPHVTPDPHDTPTPDPHDVPDPHVTPDPHDTPTPDPHDVPDPHVTPDPHDTPTPDPHDTNGTPDPHDVPTDPHDPHVTPTDPHDPHVTPDPHDTDPHTTTPG